MIVAAVPDAPATGLVDAPEDQAERLVAQAARFGKADLVRAADSVAAGLTEMRGATTPRLLLELICARVLLPGADHSTDGLMARLDRLERRMDVAGSGDQAGAPVRAGPVGAGPVGAGPVRAGPVRAGCVGYRPRPCRPRLRLRRRRPGPARRSPTSRSRLTHRPARCLSRLRRSRPRLLRRSRLGARHALGLVDVRRIWPDLLERVREMRRYTWILLSQNAQVIGLEGNVLTVGFKNAGARDSFLGGGSEEILRQAAIEVIGADWKVEAIVDPSADPGAGTAPRVTKAGDGEPAQPAPQARRPHQPRRAAARPHRPRLVRSRRRSPPPASNIAPTRTGERAGDRAPTTATQTPTPTTPMPTTTGRTAPSCSSASSAPP